MNTLLSIIGAILVFVLGTLFAVPHFVDWNQYRGIIEEEASRAVGRDVRIGANVRVRLLPTPSIRIEDVRIADTSALTGEPIFRSSEVSAKLAISPLLRGAVEVSEIELVQPVVRLVVDDGGVGNWQSLSASAPGLSYLPSNISLNTVIVSDGKLVVYSDGGRSERLVLDGIAGDVSTPGPSSPHRFKGRVSLAGAAYDVRGQLTEADGQGSRRVSMTARSDAGGTTRLEGRTETIAGLPAVKGEIVANIPFSPDGKGGGVQSVEIKTELAADTRAADLTNIQIAFESGDRPQSLSGTGRIRWQGETDLTMSIGAQWLDIDALSGFKPDSGDTPLAALGRTFDRLPAWARVGGGKRAIRFSVSQAALGGDTVSGITALLVGSGTATRIDEFRATVPGGGRIEAAGALTGPDAQNSRFSGMAMVKALSVSRLVTWATGTRPSSDVRYDTPIDVTGNVEFAPGAASASGLSGQAGDSRFAGSIDYGWGAKPSVRIALTGPVIDLRALDTGDGKAESLLSILDRLTETTGTQARASASLSLAAGTLKTLRRSYTGVTASVSLVGDTIDIRRLDAMTEEGAAISAEGRLTRVAAAAPTARRLAGELRGAVTVPHAGALKSVVELAGLPDTWIQAGAKVAAALPLTLAGRAEFADQPTKPALRLTADGMAGAVRTRIDGTLEAIGAKWAASATDLTATFDSPDDRAIDRLVSEAVRAIWSVDVASRKSSKEASGDPDPGILRLRAVGTPQQTLSVLVSHEAGGGAVTFTGRASDVDSAPKLAGELSVTATDGATALSVLPLVPVDVVAGVPLSGRARASFDAGRLQLDDIEATAGPVSVRGKLALASETPKVTSIDGTLALGHLDVRALLDLLTDRGKAAQAAAQGITVAMGRSGVWPERPFDFGLAEAYTGRIALTADRLLLPDGIAGSKASATLQFGSGRLELADITTAGLGGKWTADASLEKQPGGAALRAGLRLDQGDLGRIGGSGPVAGQAKVTASGVSPAALIAALTGAGAIDVGQTSKASGLAARALRQIVERSLASTPDQLGPVLRTGVAEAQPQDVPLGSRKIGFDIASGLARLRPVVVEGGDGRVLVGGRLDLASFVIASDWQVDTKMPPPPSATIPLPPGLAALPPLPQKSTSPLPPVIVTTSEPLASLGSPGAKRTRKIELNDLERELAVRKVERDLEALERMRQIDEELQKIRARERAEELARREAEAAAAAAAAAIVPGGAGGTAEVEGAAATTAQPPANEVPQAAVQPATPTLVPPPPVPIEAVPRPAVPRQPGVSAPKSSTGVRPLTDEERRRIFNGSGG